MRTYDLLGQWSRALSLKTLKIFHSFLRHAIELLSKMGINKTRLIIITHRLLLRNLKPTVAKVGGNTLFLASNESYHLEMSLFGVVEPVETDVFIKHIHGGSTVIDIGANIGYYTMLAAQIVGSNGKVYAFEPEPNNFKLLQKNVEYNGYTNAVLVRKAVSNTNGKIKLYLAPSETSTHRIYRNEDHREHIFVDVTTLDQYFDNMYPPVDLIKIDIEGAEYGAIKGMENLLRAKEDVNLITEFWPLGLQEFGSSAESFLALLERCGFTTFFEINEGTNSVTPMSRDELLTTYTVAKCNITNLFCIKNDCS
jgi:FkbM family methyltransferase